MLREGDNGVVQEREAQLRRRGRDGVGALGDASEPLNLSPDGHGGQEDARRADLGRADL